MDARMLYVHALSPLHNGTGQSVGLIDLPVARERVLGWPYLPGSSLKGVLRDACRPMGDEARFIAAFGPETAQASEGAGALWFTDARLLCLPVRSYHGSFAWVSCPLAIRRWQRDHVSGGMKADIPEPPSLTGTGILLPDAKSVLSRDGLVMLEDLDLKPEPDRAASTIADLLGAVIFDDLSWRREFAARFGIVADDLFTFLTETATEIVARIRLNDTTKTVESGGLWYEELVPAETIFACPLLAQPRGGMQATELFGLLTDPSRGLLQIGGQASIGRGLVALHVREGLQ